MLHFIASVSINNLKYMLFVACISLVSACGGGSNEPAAKGEKTDNSVAVPLFSENQSVYAMDVLPQAIYNKYEYSVRNGIIYETHSLLRENVIRHIFTDTTDDYVLTKDGVFFQDEMDFSKKEQPWKFLISDNGFQVTYSFYNNANQPNVASKTLTYDRVDVSGKKINSYIYKTFLENKDDVIFSDAIKASVKVFPQGAIVYIPKLETPKEEYYAIYARKSSRSYDNLASVEDIEKYPLSKIFGNIEIRYNMSQSVEDSLGYALYGGRVYQTFHREKNRAWNYHDVGSNFFYNSVAMDAVAAEIIASCANSKNINCTGF